METEQTWAIKIDKATTTYQVVFNKELKYVSISPWEVPFGVDHIDASDCGVSVYVNVDSKHLARPKAIQLINTTIADYNNSDQILK